MSASPTTAGRLAPSKAAERSLSHIPLLVHPLRARIGSVVDGVGLGASQAAAPDGLVTSIVRARAGGAALPRSIDPDQGPEVVSRAARVSAARRDLERGRARPGVRTPQRKPQSIPIERPGATARRDRRKESER